MQPTPVFLPGKPHGRRNLVGCSPWGLEESDTAERLHFHFSLSYIGEGNGNPLHCSCLENPRDGGAWLASIYGVAQSQTRLKRLSSSSRRRFFHQSPNPWQVENFLEDRALFMNILMKFKPQKTKTQAFFFVSKSGRFLLTFHLSLCGRTRSLAIKVSVVKARDASLEALEFTVW